MIFFMVVLQVFLRDENYDFNFLLFSFVYP